MTTTHIDILRHGKPEGGHRYRGHGVDDPLSEFGWRQMWAAVGDEWPWDAFFSSPMKRCRPFAEELAAKIGLPVTVDERLREVGFGSWEGKTRGELDAEDPEARRRFYADPVSARPAGAEPLERFRQRVGAALGDILASNAQQRVLVVAHAGVMRAALSWLLDAPLERMYCVDVSHAALMSIRMKPDRPPQIAFGGPVLK